MPNDFFEDDDLLFYELSPTFRYARETSRTNQQNVRKVDRELDELEEKVEHLSLIVKSMWRILKANGLSEDKTLMKTMEKLDLEKENDSKPKECVKCKRVVAKHHLRCLYCGAEQEDIAKLWRKL